ncbi:hypothetical protein INT46_011776 [Mucor plumbeus]|uniref:HTH CENPB-type domain-containing protein n=1 Tax=Mucor plumbeus TaxID=97098 RepID=A0A8H7QMH4_9FUNG|nr:hypothetical protein INT46_011776 [Mucor plumbeus]
MSNNTKQTRERLTVEQKYAICIQSLIFPQMSQIELGEWAKEEFSLPKAVKQKTISNVLINKDKIFSDYAAGNIKGKSSKKSRFPELDDDIAKYIESMNTRFVSINRATVIFYVKMIANKKYKMYELPENDRIKFSDGWLTDLFKRIGVKSRHLYGENSSV